MRQNVSKLCALLKNLILFDCNGLLCEDIGPRNCDHEEYRTVGVQAVLLKSSVKGAIHS